MKNEILNLKDLFELYRIKSVEMYQSKAIKDGIRSDRFIGVDQKSNIKLITIKGLSKEYLIKLIDEKKLYCLKAATKYHSNGLTTYWVTGRC